MFARQRAPRRTADFSQFPGVCFPEKPGSVSSSQNSNGPSSVGGSERAGGDAAADDKGSVGKYDEDEEYDDEEDDSEDEDDASSTERDDIGDEDNEEIDITQFEGEPIIPNKESAEEQISFCIKVSIGRL